MILFADDKVRNFYEIVNNTDVVDFAKKLFAYVYFVKFYEHLTVEEIRKFINKLLNQQIHIRCFPYRRFYSVKFMHCNPDVGIFFSVYEFPNIQRSSILSYSEVSSSYFVFDSFSLHVVHSSIYYQNIFRQYIFINNEIIYKCLRNEILFKELRIVYSDNVQIPYVIHVFNDENMSNICPCGIFTKIIDCLKTRFTTLLNIYNSIDVNVDSEYCIFMDHEFIHHLKKLEDKIRLEYVKYVKTEAIKLSIKHNYHEIHKTLIQYNNYIFRIQLPSYLGGLPEDAIQIEISKDKIFVSIHNFVIEHFCRKSLCDILDKVLENVLRWIITTKVLEKLN